MIDGIPLVDAHVTPRLWRGSRYRGQTGRAAFRRARRRGRSTRTGLVVPERFHAYLEQEGVDIALVFAEYSPKVTGIQAVEDILPLVEHDPGRVRLVANLNPHLHHPVTGGARAPARPRRRRPQDPPGARRLSRQRRALYKAYAICEERGIPVIVHFGTSIYPGAVEPLRGRGGAERRRRRLPRPQARARARRSRLGVRGGAASSRSAGRTSGSRSRACPPKRLPEYFARFDLARLAERFIFGTDWPGVPGIRANAEAVAGLGFDRDLLEKVFYRNALAVYGLELPS